VLQHGSIQREARWHEGTIDARPSWDKSVLSIWQFSVSNTCGPGKPRQYLNWRAFTRQRRSSVESS